jgi:hypothetical protein
MQTNEAILRYRIKIYLNLHERISARTRDSATRTEVCVHVHRQGMQVGGHWHRVAVIN